MLSLTNISISELIEMIPVVTSEEKSFIVHELIKRGEPSIDYLLDSLDHNETLIRQYCAKALGYSGEHRQKAVELLVNTLRKETDENVLLEVEKAIARYYPSKDDFQSLFSLLDQTHSQDSFYIRLLKTISWIDRDEVLDLFLRLSHQYEPRIQAICLQVLLRTGRNRLERITTHLNNQRDKNHEIIIEGLGWIGDETVCQILEKYIYHDNFIIRTKAIWALARVIDNKTLEYFFELLLSDDIRTRSSVSAVICQTQNIYVLQIAKKMLDEEKPIKQKVRTTMLLQKLQFPAIDVIQVALYSPEELVQIAALRVITHPVSSQVKIFKAMLIEFIDRAEYGSVQVLQEAQRSLQEISAL